MYLVCNSSTSIPNVFCVGDGTENLHKFDIKYETKATSLQIVQPRETKAEPLDYPNFAFAQQLK